MNREDRYKLYEKLYFYELDRREKISARLTLPFGAILAAVGLLSFLLNSKSRPADNDLSVLFWLLLVASSVALLVGAWFFRGAWFGHTDKLIATANDIEAYHAELEATYKEEADGGESLVREHFDNYVFFAFVRSASVNAVNNDRRSYNLYRASLSLTIAVLLALAAAIPFYLGSTP
ncbi:hypothetical protein [Pseudomonas sp. CGJS7]|uniref:hypothetical protein n=1 Tax=Pseudomonas sp. CGJS7 TaxID=3109348 RepID=UPI00300BA428